ncbi:hypothetical protein TSAR_007332 [Trichomalopsis sarcophagae]|uniref:Uncharacterized protein n=1 Tax=Trichomalopsis sarcophagae TaxID=543379 RepID=A0A232EEA2_9HYME|nr:hypothetical protein TSAR_007332 [Trichomalopsis sarcophagae]
MRDALPNFRLIGLKFWEGAPLAQTRKLIIFYSDPLRFFYAVIIRSIFACFLNKKFGDTRLSLSDLSITRAKNLCANSPRKSKVPIYFGLRSACICRMRSPPKIAKNGFLTSIRIVSISQKKLKYTTCHGSADELKFSAKTSKHASK